ncbi:MAG: hypothetical protein Q4A01_05980 [Coriobacteriales bacterium]|nr:hypothetical protein [Coriobacteriales bacterium]
MALTLSHWSSLYVLRALRADGIDLRAADSIGFLPPSPWKGKNWNAHNFDPEYWRWLRPAAGAPLHVLIPNRSGRLRAKHIVTHSVWCTLPPGSILWVDEHTRMVAPELLFVQMAEEMPLPALVMLGYELCGHFYRFANNPLGATEDAEIPTATSVDRLTEYLSTLSGMHGVSKAQEALQYVNDHAISVPEAVLATMYSLPVHEAGYGMGPVVLNERVDVDGSGAKSNRYPDLSFSFAPLGLNYDGEGHLDLGSVAEAAKRYALADSSSKMAAHEELRRTLADVRAKVVDDNERNRQLASRGRIVFPVTKENLYGWGNLDNLTRQILECARAVFGVDTREHLLTLDNTDQTRDRYALLTSLLSSGGAREAPRGKN